MMGILTGLITAVSLIRELYSLKKVILPTIDKVKDIESTLTGIENNSKHKMVMRFLEGTPVIWKFITKCGWSYNDVNVFISLCVILAKKPPTVKANWEKWNQDDAKVVFDFIGIVSGKWLKVFKAK